MLRRSISPCRRFLQKRINSRHAGESDGSVARFDSPPTANGRSELDICSLVNRDSLTEQTPKEANCSLKLEDEEVNRSRNLRIAADCARSYNGPEHETARPKVISDERRVRNSRPARPCGGRPGVHVTVPAAEAEDHR